MCVARGKATAKPKILSQPRTAREWGPELLVVTEAYLSPEEKATQCNSGSSIRLLCELGLVIHLGIQL